MKIVINVPNDFGEVMKRITKPPYPSNPVTEEDCAGFVAGILCAWLALIGEREAADYIRYNND